MIWSGPAVISKCAGAAGVGAAVVLAPNEAALAKIMAVVLIMVSLLYMILWGRRAWHSAPLGGLEVAKFAVELPFLGRDIAL